MSFIPAIQNFASQTLFLQPPLYLPLWACHFFFFTCLRVSPPPGQLRWGLGASHNQSETFFLSLEFFLLWHCWWKLDCLLVNPPPALLLVLTPRILSQVWSLIQIGPALVWLTWCSFFIFLFLCLWSIRHMSCSEKSHLDTSDSPTQSPVSAIPKE